MIELIAGNIYDNTTNFLKEYQITPIISDEYQFEIDNGSVTLYFNNTILLENMKKGTITLSKENTYKLVITTATANEEFKLLLYPLNNSVVETYPIIYKKGANNKISMKPRKGGTYLFNNVPENMQQDVLNTIIMENKNLSGDCFLTFENQNNTGSNIYMGYRLINENNFDVYVTITNLGYQCSGSWLGEKSWMDYYGLKFPLDIDKFKKEKFIYANKEYDSFSWEKDYLNFDKEYTPSPIKISTYKIPAKKYLYIIGGTSKDNYNDINVKTANVLINQRECINGNVKFKITNGKVKGQLCVYNDATLLNQKDTIIYELTKHGENDDLGGRMGYCKVHGVVDNNTTFTFDDTTLKGNLPVYYTNYYSDNVKEVYTPGEKIKDVTKHLYKDNVYKTHLSSQLHHDYVGTDLIEHITTFNKKKCVLSTYIANPGGNIWDYGNWMIEYQDNQTFVNNGNNTRTIRHYLTNPGSIFYIIKDLKGNIIKTGATCEIATGIIPVFEFEVAPHSKVTYSIQYVLPANDCGSMVHYNELI